MIGRGLILAAPQSGSGKTTVTLGLLRALSRRGIAVRPAKSGPDYIDPAFHEAACGTASINLDAWAMTKARIRSYAATTDLLIIEGAMGLFDGAPPDGKGATADLARILGLPVVLVVDARAMSHSVAALVNGFARHDPEVRVVGVILNRVGSPRHEAMLRQALARSGMPVLGALPRDATLALPSRHLGLVPAGETDNLDSFLSRAADRVAGHVDLDALCRLAATFKAAGAFRQPGRSDTFPRRIAVARDAAFAFCYPHLLAEWRQGGAEVRFFSPLADDPVPDAELIFLPGGYPELHAARLSAAGRFMQSLKAAAETSEIYGECGGYMVLGEQLTDAGGQRHPMAGLLALETTFAERRLHLGYRKLTGPGSRAARQMGLAGQYTGHEFHYASTLRAEGQPLWRAEDAEGNRLPDMGLVNGNVSGSFAHVIDVI